LTGFRTVSQTDPTADGDTTAQGPHPVGAAMVVGGGIAGMQASLDLAEQGFKVTLVEAKSAIGGHMAQLDKTFPTNDCAMCAISPKLVETGRHLNIEILTNTEVLGLAGEAGNFTARLRRKPRYIDLDKCVGCGDCAKVCPSVVADDFNESLTSRRAAFRLYAQAIPAAYAIDKKGVAPCRDACPAGQRAQGYIAMIRQGRYADAMRVIKEDNPFPGICGRVCDHKCEQACTRNLLDQPVGIRGLKRFVADWAYARPRQPVEPVTPTRPERIAIIGAGPCGLTAAADLARRGYGVTVFEALPVAGGMLRVGVPEYRLPTAIIDREVQDIVDLGIDLRLNSRVDDLDQLFAQGFAAVLVAVGAHKGGKLPIAGADLPGALVSTGFLRDVRLPGPPADEVRARIAGKRVIVLGGGNVAMDCARTAVRLGAASVAVACLESRNRMPAHAWEVAEAEEEGVSIHPARSVTRIIEDGNATITGIECRTVSALSFDSARKPRIETLPDSEQLLACDTVIFAIGQTAELSFISGDAVAPGSGLLAVEAGTFATARPGVFAAGDATTGTTFVIEAVAAGHKVAASIHAHLAGEPIKRASAAAPVARITQQEADARLARGEFRRVGRQPMPVLPLPQRTSGFAELESGYGEADAQAEAARCLDCGLCSECLSCVHVCGAKAINHDEVERIEEIRVGAVVLAPGYQAYNAALSQEFGFGRFPNVVTSLQFERLLSASGPTGGHVQRPSDGAKAKKIAFLQCIGSRDQSHDYCSAVCCMYAAKEAIMAKEHEPDTEVHVFMMDMRAFSKNYEEYYARAREKYGVQYHRCRISALAENSANRNLILRRLDDRGSGVVSQEFDLVVLSVGMEISPAVRQLGRDLGVELDDYGFCATTRFDPLQTSRPGVYAAGPFRQPKDIPETVVEASAAAGQAAGMLAAARGMLAREKVYPPERQVDGEEPKVGVFVCHCGSNIAGFVDVPGVAAYAGTLPHVAHAEDMLYACSQDSIATIAERIGELGLNRAVVASCTPRTHEPLFQDAMRQAGLNPYLFEMANIRNQCSWVHSGDKGVATQKAKQLLRMSVARVQGLEALDSLSVPIERSALVVGGGPAGMTAALALADQGYPVHLVERRPELGGNLRHVYSFADNGDDDPQAFLRDAERRVRAHPLITLHLSAELSETSGFLGNFSSRLSDGCAFRHGVTIVATGGREYRGAEHGYGTDPRILTQQEFEARLAGKNAAPLPDAVVMIQCVGPADRYCGRICCTTALKNALRLKTLNPAAEVTVLYKDIRTYGFKERIYAEARRRGVRFVRFDEANRPTVEGTSACEKINLSRAGALAGLAGNHTIRAPSARGGLAVEPARAPALVIDPAPPLMVRVRDPILQVDLALKAELVVLSTPMVPSEGMRELGSKLKVPVDADGWFLEAHVKLRPVDFASEGLFVAGAAHYPKFLDETLVQARAAASRAANILAQEALRAGGAVAKVAAEQCTGCLTCVRICPYQVPRISMDLQGVGGIGGAAYIEPAICQGCGSCASECPAKAISVLHYRDGQVMAKVDALFEGAPHVC
jgi:heterodisulfide reductase subunit A-like polyferredoxin